MRLISPEFIRRVVAGMGFPLGRGGEREPIQGADLGNSRTQTNQPMPSPERREPFFGPGRPLTPIVADRTEVEGRALDFPYAMNQQVRPRAAEPLTFEMLRRMADASTGYDLLRLAIETRKDQAEKLTWSILPREKPGQTAMRKPDARCAEIERFLRRPDRRLSWQTWVRMLLEDLLVIDAPTVFVRRDSRGVVYSLDVVDGSTIKPLVDETGRAPMGDEPAYQQVLKGIVVANYTFDELLYAPRNPRPHKIYGYSPVEQVIMTVNIALRRQMSQLDLYTVGNIPPAIIAVPPEWTPQQIQQFQAYWDAVMEGDRANLRRAKFVPAGVQPMMTRPWDSGIMDQFDEWLARIIAYAFSLPPTPFVRMVNRATAEIANETAQNEGLQPLMSWLKNFMDRIIEVAWGETDIEFVFDETRKLDPTEQANMEMAQMRMGIRSLDEIRAEHGLDPLGLPAIVFGVGPLGFMPVSDMKRAIEQGLTMPQAPMAPDMMGQPGVMGQPGMMGSPGAGRSLAPEVAREVMDQLPPSLRRFVDGALTPRAMGRAATLVDDDEDPAPPPNTLAGFMHDAMGEADKIARVR
jgi:HK97 family phage portal protein